MVSTESPRIMGYLQSLNQTYHMINKPEQHGLLAIARTPHSYGEQRHWIEGKAYRRTMVYFKKTLEWQEALRRTH